VPGSPQPCNPSPVCLRKAHLGAFHRQTAWLLLSLPAQTRFLRQPTPEPDVVQALVSGIRCLCGVQSAKSNLNVDNVFFTIARDIKQRLAESQEERPEVRCVLSSSPLLLPQRTVLYCCHSAQYCIAIIVQIQGGRPDRGVGASSDGTCPLRRAQMPSSFFLPPLAVLWTLSGPCSSKPEPTLSSSDTKKPTKSKTGFC